MSVGACRTATTPAAPRAPALASSPDNGDRAPLELRNAPPCTRILPAVSGAEPVLLEITMVPLASMPFAHSPFRCAHKARFTEVRGAAQESGDETVAGRLFFEQLDPAAFEECPYHRGDWRRIAEAAGLIVDGLAGGAPLQDVLRSLRARLVLSEDDALWLWSLFDDPICWRPGEDEVVNGQHRLCALRAAGVPCAPVELLPS